MSPLHCKQWAKHLSLPGTVGTSMPRATHGIFVNFEDDGTILFRGMQRRGERTAFSFARTVLPDLHRTAIPIHVGSVAALVLPGEEYSLKVYGGPWGFACSKQHGWRPQETRSLR